MKIETLVKKIKLGNNVCYCHNSFDGVPDFNHRKSSNFHFDDNKDDATDKKQTGRQTMKDGSYQVFSQGRKNFLTLTNRSHSAVTWWLNTMPSGYPFM